MNRKLAELEAREAAGRRPIATPSETAQYLQIPLRTLGQWRYTGDGPRFLRIGRHVRYRWEDIDAWLNQQGSAA